MHRSALPESPVVCPSLRALPKNKPPDQHRADSLLSKPSNDAGAQFSSKIPSQTLKEQGRSGATQNLMRIHSYLSRKTSTPQPVHSIKLSRIPGCCGKKGLPPKKNDVPGFYLVGYISDGHERLAQGLGISLTPPDTENSTGKHSTAIA